MGRTVEIVSAGESFEVSARDRTYQGKAPVVAFKVDGNVAPGAAGQVQFAAAPSIAGAVQATSTGLLQTVITGSASPASITVTGAKVGDKVISVIDLTTPAASTDFESVISIAGKIQRTATASGATDKFLVTISQQS